MKDKANILDYKFEELLEEMLRIGEKKFRAVQIFGWLSKGVENFSDMKNISKETIDKLDKNFYIGMPQVATEQFSKDEGTRKYLYKLHDGNRIESVFMKHRYGNSICISSQVGCRMGCTFCASTKAGFVRNLTGGEMLAQILKTETESGEKINHVVIMGIGEPFDNYENMSNFLNIVHDSRGFNLSMRNITVSTCGIIPMIDRFGDDFPQVNLAISLHAPNSNMREKIMPISKKYDFDDLMSACRRYTKKTSRRITFEYTLIAGVNDSHSCADQLSRAVRGMIHHINLIPLNSVTESGMSSSDRATVDRFRGFLEKAGTSVTVRRTLGSDIDAACGQLRTKQEKK